jgi:hypothetical protein
MLKARIALAAAVVLGGAFVPATAHAAQADPDLPGYRCQVIYAEDHGDYGIDADGHNCIPVNGAPAEGEVSGPFFITDGGESYVCQTGRVDPPWVWTHGCSPEEEAPADLEQAMP